MPDPLPQLRALLPLAERATEAPWRAADGSKMDYYHGPYAVLHQDEDRPCILAQCNTNFPEKYVNDGPFIAASRNFLTPETIRELIRVLESRGDA